ncbi:MAG: tRNA (adenosine(37)-N6)-threonylcarbamoyltransferase complex ATPase subunit type 1 TsaE [Bryobacteraceae bacterium]
MLRSESLLHFVTQAEEETIALGRMIAEKLKSRAVVLLIGNLGAGKTTLAKGIVSALGGTPAEEVSSPTYTLVHEYGLSSKGVPVYHIDLYRLDTAEEVMTLGLDELFDRDGIVLIEWGERFPQLLPTDRVEIRLEPVDDGDSRKISITGLRS